MNPMVDEVNKIVYNLLAAEHAVHIPSVGSLLVERVPAKRLSKRRIVPPYFAVIFTSHAVGTSLTDAVAKAANCDAAAAQEVCERWLGRTMQEGVLTIGGVGVLRQKGFTVDPAFDRKINPQERAPMTVRSSGGHWLFWTLSSAAIICGIGACGWILYDQASEDLLPETPLCRIEPAAQSAGTAGDNSGVAVDSVVTAVSADSAALAGTGRKIGGETSSGTVSAEAETASSLSAATPADANAVPPAGAASAKDTGANLRPAGQADAAGSLAAANMVPGRSYVVLGVFSTEQNAQRAAKEAMQADSSLQCGVWRYGSKFMASLFASDDAAACAAFTRAHADRYPEAWSYKAR